MLASRTEFSRPMLVSMWYQVAIIYGGIKSPNLHDIKSLLITAYKDRG